MLKLQDTSSTELWTYPRNLEGEWCTLISSSRLGALWHRQLRAPATDRCKRLCLQCCQTWWLSLLLGEFSTFSALPCRHARDRRDCLVTAWKLGSHWRMIDHIPTIHEQSDSWPCMLVRTVKDVLQCGQKIIRDLQQQPPFFESCSYVSAQACPVYRRPWKLKVDFGSSSWCANTEKLAGPFERLFLLHQLDLLFRWQDIGTNHQSIPRKWRKIRPLTCLRPRKPETEVGQLSTSHKSGRCMHWWSLMSCILQCISLCKYSNITAYYILYNCLILVWANLFVALCYWPDPRDIGLYTLALGSAQWPLPRCGTSVGLRRGMKFSCWVFCHWGSLKLNPVKVYKQSGQVGQSPEVQMWMPWITTMRHLCIWQLEVATQTLGRSTGKNALLKAALMLIAPSHAVSHGS